MRRDAATPCWLLLAPMVSVAARRQGTQKQQKKARKKRNGSAVLARGPILIFPARRVGATSTLLPRQGPPANGSGTPTWARSPFQWNGLPEHLTSARVHTIFSLRKMNTASLSRGPPIHLSLRNRDRDDPNAPQRLHQASLPAPSQTAWVPSSSSSSSSSSPSSSSVLLLRYCISVCAGTERMDADYNVVC